MKLIVRLTLSVIAAVSMGSLAQAAATRSFVASTGSDGNTATNCSIANPCRTFLAAYGVTNAGGEIVALDSAGFGTLSISHELSIVGAKGAFIAVGAGQTGISISAGSTDRIFIKNVQITGNGFGTTTGISLTSGRLVLQDSTLRLLSTGLSVTGAKATVSNTDINFNDTAVSTSGAGVDQSNLSTTAAGATEVRISNGSVTDNGIAFFQNNPGTSPGSSRSAIWLRGGANTGDLFNIVGNTIMIAGAGAGCSPCTVGIYQTGANFNLY